MADTPIAVQLYSVREDCAEDLPGTLAALAKMGYQGVEFAGYYGRSAAELKKLLAENGLQAEGAHVGHEVFSDEELPRTIEFHQELGCKYLVIAHMPLEILPSRQHWADFAKRMTEVAEKLKPHGLLPGLHNGWTEFAPLDGEAPWDTFAANSSDDVVMQLDLGNCLHGGADAMGFLRKWAHRGRSIHLKEHSAANPKALVGEGDVPWREVFEVCAAAGNTEWFVVEQEVYPYPPLESVERCLRFLRNLGQ